MHACTTSQSSAHPIPQLYPPIIMNCLDASLGECTVLYCTVVLMWQQDCFAYTLLESITHGTRLAHPRPRGETRVGLDGQDSSRIPNWQARINACCSHRHPPPTCRKSQSTPSSAQFSASGNYISNCPPIISFISPLAAKFPILNRSRRRNPKRQQHLEITDTDQIEAHR